MGVCLRCSFGRQVTRINGVLKCYYCGAKVAEELTHGTWYNPVPPFPKAEETQPVIPKYDLPALDFEDDYDPPPT